MALEQAEESARASEQSLHEYLENRTITDIVEQFNQDENCEWLMNHDFFMGNHGTFATVREVSETSHDIMMGDTISSDVSMRDADSPREDDGQGQAATLDETAATAQSGGSLETAGLSSSSASAPRTILGVEAPPGLFAIEDLKPDEYYQAADQIRGALQNLPDQIQQQEEPRTANWVHTTLQYSSSLWTDYEHARKACDRTGARINFVIRSLEFGPERPHAQAYNKIALPGLLPYLDDYIMGAHDPFVEDFHWSMDDNRHTESKSPELTEGDVPNLLLFAERDVINRVRTEAAGSVAQVAGRDTEGARAFALSSSDVLATLAILLASLFNDRLNQECCGPS